MISGESSHPRLQSNMPYKLATYSPLSLGSTNMEFNKYILPSPLQFVKKFITFLCFWVRVEFVGRFFRLLAAVFQLITSVTPAVIAAKAGIHALEQPPI